MSEQTEPWKWGDDKHPTDAYDTAPDGTRFLMCGYDAHPKEFASGDWVRYSDYEKLKAENERLRKAGDAMAHEICLLWPCDENQIKAIYAWQDAKQPPTDQTK